MCVHVLFTYVSSGVSYSDMIFFSFLCRKIMCKNKEVHVCWQRELQLLFLGKIQKFKKKNEVQRKSQDKFAVQNDGKFKEDN